LARALLNLGAQPGDRVALLLQNSPDFVALAHAAPRAAVVLVPLNTRLAAPELAWQLADAGARLLIYDAQNAALVELVLKQLAELQPPLAGRTIAVDVATLAARSDSGVALRETIDLSQVYTIIYTSGTTGRPKGAMLTYGNYWWSAVGSALNLGNHAD